MRLLLSKLLALDDGLDLFLLVTASIIVTPPDRSLVFADEAEMFAGAAETLVLIALLSSESASVASCIVNALLVDCVLKGCKNYSKVPANWRIVQERALGPGIACKWLHVPVLERRCISAFALAVVLSADLEAVLAFAVFVAAILVLEIEPDEASRSMGDWEGICKRRHLWVCV